MSREPGDAADIDLGLPEGSEAGFLRPAVVVTSEVVLRRGPRIVQVVPLTTTRRRYPTELDVAAAESGLSLDSVAQAHHVRSVSAPRVRDVHGRLGSVVLSQLRELLADLLDL
jgi:mRNA interferase MazF